MEGLVGETFFFVNTHDHVKCVKMAEDLWSVEGYLLRYRTPDNAHADLTGQYFLETTDFGLQKTSPIFYQHLQNGLLKSIPLSGELGNLKSLPAGRWIEGQINLAKSYAEMVANKYGVSVDEYLDAANSILEMYQKNILGWSSGTSGHTMKAVKMNDGSEWLSMWHLGLDASLTPNPAEFKTIPQFQKALPLKSMVEMVESGFGQVIEISSNSVGNPQEKGGKVISKTNLSRLNSIRTELSNFADDLANQYGLTDKVEANEEGAFSMTGEEVKTVTSETISATETMTDETKAMGAATDDKKKCPKCAGDKMKLAEVALRPNKTTKEYKPDKWDVWSILYNAKYTVEYADINFLDVEAIRDALHQAGVMLVELKASADETKNVEVEPVSDEKAGTKNTESEAVAESDSAKAVAPEEKKSFGLDEMVSSFPM